VTDPVTLGHALLGIGASVTIVAVSLNVLCDEGAVVRRVGRVVNAIVGPLTRPFRAFHTWLGRPPTERCERRGWHRVNWDGYHEVCTCCGRGRYELNVDGVSCTEWVYPDNQWIVPGPLLIPPRSPSGVSTLADDLRCRSDVWYRGPQTGHPADDLRDSIEVRRRPDPVVEAFVGEVGRVLDEARYARPIEYGRYGRLREYLDRHHEEDQP
jgi:hypothetical protein